MRIISIAAFGALVLGGATPALAAPDAWLDLSIASRGISKGIAQTDGAQFLARGELGFGALLLGAYAKNVDASTYDGEVGGSIGVRHSVGGFDMTVSATLKQALSATEGSDATALEVAGSVSRHFGKITPKLSAVWSPDDLGGTGHTLFAEAGAGYAATKHLTLSAALGRRERSGGADYTAFNAGVAWSPIKALTLDAHYYDTDGGGDSYPYRARGVVSAKVRF